MIRISNKKNFNFHKISGLKHQLLKKSLTVSSNTSIDLQNYLNPGFFAFSTFNIHRISE